MELKFELYSARVSCNDLEEKGKKGRTSESKLNIQKLGKEPLAEKRVFVP